MNLTAVAGDVVSVLVDQASADVTSAMVLRARGARPVRVPELLRRAAKHLEQAAAAASVGGGLSCLRPSERRRWRFPPVPRHAARSRRRSK